jgi:hypothetical protein
MSDRELWRWRFIGAAAIVAGVGLVLSGTYPALGWFLIVSNAALFIVGFAAGGKLRPARGQDANGRGVNAEATDPEVKTMLDQWSVEDDRFERYTSFAVKTLVLTASCVVAAIAGVQGIALAGIAIAVVALLFILDPRTRDSRSRRS